MFPLENIITTDDGINIDFIYIDKVSLIRGSSRVINGIHGIENIDKEKISDITTQHHHFKWTSKTLENFQRQYNGLRDCGHNWYVEYSNVLDYLNNQNTVSLLKVLQGYHLIMI